MRSALSADGRYALFASNASDLTATDTNGSRDVFLFDRVTGTVTLVSRSTAGSTTTANHDSFAGALSADGRYALFESAASDLTATDTNGALDVFLFDREVGTVTLVSRSMAGPTTTGNGESSARPDTRVGRIAFLARALSVDGRYVFFESFASDLTATDTNGSQDVFLFDREAETVTLVSRSMAGPTTTANSGSLAVHLSADGRYALFDSVASDLTATDTNGALDVFLFDREAGTVTLVSRSTAGPTTTGNGESSARPLSPVVRPFVGRLALRAKALSADGRYVVFDSFASDLTATDTNGTDDVFLFDRVTGTVTLVSRALSDPEATGNGRSDSPIIFEDGSVVVFRSDASDLVENDVNSAGDIFLFSVTDTHPSTVVTLCSVLGDDRKPSVLDQDVFRFDGTKGERVTITLAKEVGGAHSGERATVVLKDAVKGTFLFKVDNGPLPNVIRARLPSAGRYLVVVGEQPRFWSRTRFRGAYCLSLEGSAGAQSTLAPHVWVE